MPLPSFPYSNGVLTLFWLGAIGAAFWSFETYKTTPGERREAPLQWPAGSEIRRDSSRPILLLFAHPYCPCTRASLGELVEILGRCQGRVTAQVLFVKPTAVSPSWVQSDMWHTASRIPGVRTSWDGEAKEAARFGVRTSGHVVLYAAAGT